MIRRNKGKELKTLDAARKFEEVDEPLDARRLRRLEDDISESSRSDLFKRVITPDFKVEDSMDLKVIDGNVNPFTKELRTSNLNAMQLQFIVHAFDVARFASQLGFLKSSTLLISDAQTLLSAAPSIKGALLKLMSSEYSFKHIDVGKQGKTILERQE